MIGSGHTIFEAILSSVISHDNDSKYGKPNSYSDPAYNDAPVSPLHANQLAAG
jgi:hypothetical protein